MIYISLEIYVFFLFLSVYTFLKYARDIYTSKAKPLTCSRIRVLKNKTNKGNALATWNEYKDNNISRQQSRPKLKKM